MKTYEELLSDIEEDMELMGASHIVYSAEENGVITDYDYLPSDLCMTSTTLKDLQEKLHEQMLYDKASAYTAGADKNAPKLAVIFPGIGYTADKPLLYYTTRLAKKHGYQIQTVSYGTLPENIRGDSAKMNRHLNLPRNRQNSFCTALTGVPMAAFFLFPKALAQPYLLPMLSDII